MLDNFGMTNEFWVVAIKIWWFLNRTSIFKYGDK